MLKSAPGPLLGRPVTITGLGAYVPERVVTNDDLAAMLDTSDEWITQRTGIRERRIVDEGTSASDLGIIAARAALADAGLSPEQVGLVITATISPDRIMPATASRVAYECGCTGAGAMDVSAGCTGFVYALAMAAGAVASGFQDHALVVGNPLPGSQLADVPVANLILIQVEVVAGVLPPRKEDPLPVKRHIGIPNHPLGRVDKCPRVELAAVEFEEAERATGREAAAPAVGNCRARRIALSLVLELRKHDPWTACKEGRQTLLPTFAADLLIQPKNALHRRFARRTECLAKGCGAVVRQLPHGPFEQGQGRRSPVGGQPPIGR